jgi:hypothetical protein
MKIVPNRISNILAVILLSFTSVFAAPGPPPPEIAPPPPPPVNLDDGIWFLLLVSLLFGIYKLKQILAIKKASN